jgi:hypothetical protein
VGQGYVRSVADTEKVEGPDVTRYRLNRWTCGKYDMTYRAQKPCRNHDGRIQAADFPWAIHIISV